MWVKRDWIRVITSSRDKKKKLFIHPISSKLCQSLDPKTCLPLDFPPIEDKSKFWDYAFKYQSQPGDQILTWVDIKENTFV